MSTRTSLATAWSTLHAAARSVGRRRFMGLLGAGGAAAVMPGLPAPALRAAPVVEATLEAFVTPTDGLFTLPPLPYAHDALEPHIDAFTMVLHHDRHHATYVTNLNAALAPYPDLRAKPATELVATLDRLPEAIRASVRNNGGGHINHSIFWAIMGPGGGGAPVGALAEAITATFGSLDTLKQTMNAAGAARFGSGWVWLVVDAAGKLLIVSAANQDSPYMVGLTPLLGNDVWEHAYYLKYQNRRAAYLEAWWNTVNWHAVGLRYDSVRRQQA